MTLQNPLELKTPIYGETLVTGLSEPLKSGPTGSILRGNAEMSGYYAHYEATFDDGSRTPIILEVLVDEDGNAIANAHLERDGTPAKGKVIVDEAERILAESR